MTLWGASILDAHGMSGQPLFAPCTQLVLLEMTWQVSFAHGLTSQHKGKYRHDASS